MKWKPHNYQLQAVKFVVQQACAGLLLDPGLGKTSIMYAAFHLLRKKGYVRRMLVISPLRPAYSVWPAEAKRWDEFKDIKVGVIHGPNRLAVLKDPSIDVHVINPEGLAWLFSQPDFDPARYWDILCVDESTRFKHVNTQRFKILKPHLQRFKRRYILTGSPAPNGLLDLFGQVFVLDLGKNFTPFITHFRQKFFVPDYSGFNWTPKPDAEKQIYSLLTPLCLRMDAKDYLELPPLIGDCSDPDGPKVIEVELPEDAREVYDSMEDELIAVLKEETVTAASAAAVFGKCRQIANGGLYGAVTDKRSKHNLHWVKVDALEELIEELQGVPTLVAYEYEHDLDRLQQRFPDVPHIGGGVSAKRFKELEDEWNAGGLPMLFAQPQSVAHGLNLQKTRAAVAWLGLTPDLEVYEQFNRRVYRQGQEYPVFCYHIKASNTVDTVILRMLMRKDKTQRALLSALKEAYVKS